MPSGQGYTVTFDGVASTDFPFLICQKVTRKLVGKDRSVLREVAGMEGAWRFPDKRGLRTIVIEFAVVSDSFPVAREDDLSAVADWLEKPGFKELSISDKPGIFYQGFLSNEPDVDAWRELGTFEAEFLVQPYGFDVDITEASLALSPGIENTLNIPDSVPVYPVIELIPSGGNLTSFDLTVGDYTLSFGSAIGTLDAVTISSLSFTVSDGLNTDTNLEGTFVYDDLNMLECSGSFPVLVQGDNTFLIEPGFGSGATEVNLDLYWRSRTR